MREEGIFSHKEGGSVVDQHERRMLAFRNSIESLGAEAMRDMEDLYGNNPYHNPNHLLLVAKNDTRILQVIKNTNPDSGLGEEDLLLGKLEAMYHDIDQSVNSEKTKDVVDEPYINNLFIEKYITSHEDKLVALEAVRILMGGDVSEEGCGAGVLDMMGRIRKFKDDLSNSGEINNYIKRVRVREQPKIEQNSAGILLGRMQIINEKAGEKVFTDKQQHLADESIRATVPFFDVGLLTVVQPELKKDSSYHAFALALADLGAVAMNGPGMFLREGMGVLDEDHLDLTECIESPERIEGLSEERKKYMKSRLIGWRKFQKLFLSGREKVVTRLLEERKGLSEFPEETLKAVGALFDWESSKRVIDQVIKEAETMSLEELLRDTKKYIGMSEDDARIAGEQILGRVAA